MNNKCNALRKIVIIFIYNLIISIKRKEISNPQKFRLINIFIFIDVHL